MDLAIVMLLVVCGAGLIVYAGLARRDGAASGAGTPDQAGSDTDGDSSGDAGGD